MNFLLVQLLNLCEAETISYLDEVACSPGGLDLSKSVASEVSFCYVLRAGYFSHPLKFLYSSLVAYSASIN